VTVIPIGGDAASKVTTSGTCFVKITSRALTHRGSIRQSNEDAVLVDGWLRAGNMSTSKVFRPAGSAFLVAVADGLGGHNRGDVASTFALARLAALSDAMSEIDESSLRSALTAVHAELTDLAGTSLQFRGMGTTIAGLAVLRGQALLFNAGDSRIYRREGDFLQLLSVDDRLASERDFGDGAAEPATNILLQCLGGAQSSGVLSPHVSTVPLGDNETFLLCTDGLSDVLTLDEIEGVLMGNDDDPLAILLRKALDAGAPDNLTVVIVHILASPVGGGHE
jgi:PPM family protein phosphatase